MSGRKLSSRGGPRSDNEEDSGSTCSLSSPSLTSEDGLSCQVVLLYWSFVLEKWMKQMEGENNKRNLSWDCRRSLRSVEKRSVGVAIMYVEREQEIKGEF